MLKFLTRFSALMAVLIVSALPLDAFAIRPRYKAVSYNTSRPAFERLVRGLTPTMDIRPGKSTTTDLESIRVSQIDSTTGSVSFTQSTDANKPLLTEGGRRENLFTYSEQLDNAQNTMNNGTVSGNVVTEASDTNQYHYFSQTYFIPTVSGETYRWIAKVKAVGSRHISIRTSGSAGLTAGFADFDLSDCTVNGVDAGQTATASTSGDYCIVSVEETTTAAGLTSFTFYITNPVADLQYNGDGSSGLNFEYLQVQRASMSPTYIPTQTLPRHGSLTGERGLYFDGSNDLLTSASTLGDAITATAYEYFVIANPRRGILSDPVAKSNDSIFADDSSNMGITVKSDNTVSSYNYQGSSVWPQTDLSFTPGNPFLVATRYDGTNIISTLNGSSEDTTASGNPSVLTNPLWIGDRYSKPYNGVINRIITFNKNNGTSTRQRLIKGFKRFYRVN